MVGLELGWAGLLRSTQDMSLFIREDGWALRWVARTAQQAAVGIIGDTIGPPEAEKNEPSKQLAQTASQSKGGCRRRRRSGRLLRFSKMHKWRGKMRISRGLFGGFGVL